MSLKNEVNDLINHELFKKVFDILDKYEQLDPLPGILLPFIEALLPFLPLFAFVIANSLAYVLLRGLFIHG